MRTHIESYEDTDRVVSLVFSLEDFGGRLCSVPPTVEERERGGKKGALSMSVSHVSI